MESISFQYPAWYLVFCLLLGLGYALLLYFRNGAFHQQSRWLNWLFGSLRFLAVSILAILLLSPLLRSLKTETKKPVVILAQDVSESVFQSADSLQKQTYLADLGQLEKELEENYELHSFAFGSEVRETRDFTFEDKASNLTEMLRTSYDLFSNQNLGAIIMATDGIYNEGSNPVYSGSQLNVPLYTVALGDTTPKRDLWIKRVFSNRIVYLGDKFSIQVDVAARNLAGTATRMVVQRVDGDQVRDLHEEAIPIESDDFFSTKEVVLEASKSGVQRYRVVLGSVPGESSRANNGKDVFIDVLDARQKILLMAHAPHPDIGALKASLEGARNYEIKVAYARDFTGKVADFDFVILHQLPSAQFPVSGILQQLEEGGIPRWYITGTQANFASLNERQSLVQVQVDGRNINEVQAFPAPDFNLFTLSNALRSGLPNFAPVTAPFGDFSQIGGGQTLLYQRIGKIDTEYPLLILGENNGVKTGLFTGEGLWRWRLFDYLQNGNHDLFNELVGKTVQYLSLKEDKRKFRISMPKNIFDENEAIQFDGELYNENFELINEPDATLVIRNTEGREFPFTFNKKGRTYHLAAGIFPVGNYSYRASVSSAGKQYSYDGQFSIQPVQLESFETAADHGLLRVLSRSFGGRLLYPAQLDSLPKLIRANESVKPVVYSTMQTRSVINLKWIFFLILSLLTLEWFLRRYFGGY